MDDLSLIIDLKSTVDASPKGFQRSVANYRYTFKASLSGCRRNGDGYALKLFYLLQLKNSARFRRLFTWQTKP